MIFLVTMPPMGKARPRMTRRGRTYMPAPYMEWKKEFSARAKIGWCPWPKITGPFSIKVVFGTKSGKMRSDLDNCIGSVLDALQDAGLIANDRDCRQLAAKLITTKLPGISVEIEVL